MSDMHGQYDAYIKMLGAIELSDQDSLYVIGDVIDRGHGGVDILLDMMDRPNIKMIRGNHEQMMLEVLAYPLPPDDDITNWLDYNGGTATFDAYALLTPEQRSAILDYLLDTPFDMSLTVGGASYYLVHGCPSPALEPYEMIWERVEPGNPRHKRAGSTVVFGHTPTVYYQNKSPWEIFFYDGIIGIDCGCAAQIAPARLGCLRLEDLQTFYVPIRD